MPTIASRTVVVARQDDTVREERTGALGETRTRTAYATAPSRQRVYQFHHQSVDRYSICRQVLLILSCSLCVLIVEDRQIVGIVNRFRGRHVGDR